MSQLELEIYKFLEEINVLDAKVYSKLLKKYGEEIVNKVIELFLSANYDLHCIEKAEKGYPNDKLWNEASKRQKLYK